MHCTALSSIVVEIAWFGTAPLYSLEELRGKEGRVHETGLDWTGLDQIVNQWATHNTGWESQEERRCAGRKKEGGACWSFRRRETLHHIISYHDSDNPVPSLCWVHAALSSLIGREVPRIRSLSNSYSLLPFVSVSRPIPFGIILSHLISCNSIL